MTRRSLFAVLAGAPAVAGPLAVPRTPPAPLGQKTYRHAQYGMVFTVSRIALDHAPCVVLDKWRPAGPDGQVLWRLAGDEKPRA